MAYRWLGVPSSSVISILKTIQTMKHHIKTNFGDSTFYMESNYSLCPFEGILQGNRAAPVISAVLIHMLKK